VLNARNARVLVTLERKVCVLNKKTMGAACSLQVAVADIEAVVGAVTALTHAIEIAAAAAAPAPAATTAPQMVDPVAAML
jgi:hypothetical protein